MKQLLWVVVLAVAIRYGEGQYGRVADREFWMNSRKYVIVMNYDLLEVTEQYKYCQWHHQARLARLRNEQFLYDLSDKLLEIEAAEDFVLREIATGERTSKPINTVLKLEHLNDAGWRCVIISNFNPETDAYDAPKFHAQAKKCDYQRAFLCEGPGYLGCYTDSEDDLEFADEQWTMDNMTLPMCLLHCRDAGYKYMAARNGNECVCGNSYGRHGKACWCDAPCAGDDTQFCGGSWANSVLMV